MRMLLVVLYALCPVLANQLVQHHQPVAVIPNTSLTAPAAVYVIGLALVLRNLVQRTSGIPVSLLAIAAGCLTSFLVASPHIVLASVAAFAFSELLDFTVFTGLYYRVSPFAPSALIASALGATADSLIFLSIAFGSYQYLPGQIVGKLLSILAAVAVIAAFDHYHPHPQPSTSI